MSVLGKVVGFSAGYLLTSFYAGVATVAIVQLAEVKGPDELKSLVLEFRQRAEDDEYDYKTLAFLLGAAGWPVITASIAGKAVYRELSKGFWRS